jgi:IclR family transcriptional regulator, KDG regulon repressor
VFYLTKRNVKPIQPPTYVVDAVAKALEVLEAFNGAERLPLAEISQRVKLNKTRVFRLLQTLSAYGYIERDVKDGSYSLGLKLCERAAGVRLDLRQAALPLMRELQRKFNETVNLGLIDAGEVLYLENIDSKHSFRVANVVGKRSSIHSSSLGKAIAAYLEEEQVKGYFSKPLAKNTERTITDPEKLKAELVGVRRRGYALDNQEDTDGAACIGAPIFDSQGKPIAAISVSGPVDRVMQRREEIAQSLVGICQDISRHLGFPGKKGYVLGSRNDGIA